MICKVSSNTYTCKTRGHDMKLTINANGSCTMATINSSQQAHRGLGISEFKNISEVEKKYKSWRGIAALTQANTSNNNSFIMVSPLKGKLHVDCEINTHDKEILDYVCYTFSYLLKRNIETPLSEVAELIESYHSDERTKAIASKLRELSQRPTLNENPTH
ncbi:hypothetical protein [Vibrio sp. R78045]|uniref:hypothetical protein n=1 Tax=Vibrio sp. R78045 TaxID=3093868 RepID=UPI0036F299C1